MTARVVLEGIKARLAAATPGPWTHDEAFNASFVCAGEGAVADTWIARWDNRPGRKQDKADAEFIAAAPTDVARLTAALEAALEACDRVIDNKDGHKPPGPPHPTQQQATAIRIRATIENALEGE